LRRSASLPSVLGGSTIPLEIRSYVLWLACAQNHLEAAVRKSKRFLAMGVAFAMSIATVTGLASTAEAVISVPPAQAGMASSVVNMFRQLSSVLGTSVLGTSVLGTILTSKFAGNLGADLTRRKLPAPVVDQIVTGAKHGGGTSGLPANLASVVGDAVRYSFNDAFHTGLVVAGVFVLVVAVPTVLLVRHRPAR
jgi:hypothetical protein